MNIAQDDRSYIHRNPGLVTGNTKSVLPLFKQRSRSLQDWAADISDPSFHRTSDATLLRLCSYLSVGVLVGSQEISLLLSVLVIGLSCAVMATRSVSPSCMQLRCLY